MLCKMHNEDTSLFTYVWLILLSQLYQTCKSMSLIKVTVRTTKNHCSVSVLSVVGVSEIIYSRV